MVHQLIWKLSKTQLHKIGQSEGILGGLLGPLLKTELPLTRNLLKPLAKSILIPLGLTAVAADAAIHKKNVWIWHKDINNFERGNEWHHKNY